MSSASATGGVVLVRTAKVVGVEDALVIGGCCGALGRLEEDSVFIIRVFHGLHLGRVARLGSLDGFGRTRSGYRVSL
jgi:hypothetical protein